MIERLGTAGYCRDVPRRAEGRAPSPGPRRAGVSPGGTVSRSESGVPGAPQLRPGIVPRTDLVDRMLAADEAVITVIAPPGYGKTTVLAQWAARRGDRVVWVSCEPAHDDPAALWRAVRRALSRLGPVG